MKLTDFCILFGALFLCMLVIRDWKIQYVLAQKLSDVQYNIQMDRIAEDAMMDIVETEYADGSLYVRTAQLQERYEQLLQLAFDLTDDEKRLLAYEAVTLWKFQQYPYALTAEQTDALCTQLQEQVNEVKRRRREEQLVEIALPYVRVDDWYQALGGAQLVTVFDLREHFPTYDRAVFSGSRLEKKNGSGVDLRE